MNTPQQKSVIEKLESLVQRRFSIESLVEHLTNEFGVKIELEDISRDNDELCDFNLIGNIDNPAHDIFCDFDIYFLKMRKNSFEGANIYITEVGYHFE